MKEIVILGGANGAGKTTAAQVLLPQQLGIIEFVNADEIARGLSPFNAGGAAIAAGRLMIERMRSLARDGQSFAFETTCAGRGHVEFVRHLKENGWRAILLFLWLPSPQAALGRVARRVAQGGHPVPDAIVVRRYWAGLRNLHRLYLPLADVATIYDNADGGRVLIAERKPQGSLVIHDRVRWQSIEEASA